MNQIGKEGKEVEFRFIFFPLIHIMNLLAFRSL